MKKFYIQIKRESEDPAVFHFVHVSVQQTETATFQNPYPNLTTKAMSKESDKIEKDMVISHPYQPMNFYGQEEQCQQCGASKKWELNHMASYTDEDGDKVVGNG